MNNLNLNPDLGDEAWLLTKSQTGGYKVYSMGYAYTVDKPKQSEIATATKIYLRCEKYSFLKCSGRAQSCVLQKPLVKTKEHNHIMAPERKEVLQHKEVVKQRALTSHDNPRSIIREAEINCLDECISSMPKKEAIRKLISRTRDKASTKGFNAKSLANLDLTEELKFTFKNKKFYWDNIGKETGENRILMFSTEANLKLLDKYSDWYCDGTFDISPTIFKQVYTIHIQIGLTSLPMVYFLLPNKKQKTYNKMFKMLSEYLKNEPKTISCDFEKAAINAIKLVFRFVNVCGCYFHLSQSFFRRVKTTGLLKKWYEIDFRMVIVV